VCLCLSYSELDIFSIADDLLFKAVLKNSHRVLYPYFLDDQHQYHFLRQRKHDKALIPKTTDVGDRDYIIRILYKNCY